LVNQELAPFSMEFLKRIDSNVKTIDGVHSRTVMGAVVTVISTALIFVLVMSELAHYTAIETVHHLTIDSQVTSV
jgi:hypothetical protein